MASDDALSILDSLPAPEVEYDKAPINSYPDSPKESLRRTGSTAQPVEPSLNKQKSFPSNQILKNISSPALESVTRMIKNLSRAPIETKKIESNNADASAIASLAKKIEIVEKKSNLLRNFETLKKNKLVTSLQESLLKDYTLAVSVLELSQRLHDQKGQSEGEESWENEKDAKSFDAIFAKAKGLQKKEKWKDIQTLFKSNAEAGETKEGLEYQIEAELNSAKPKYSSARRLANELVKLNKTNPWANYALALFYQNLKRPNTKKASSHLAIALKAKKPPAGASKLYWMMLLKKLWIVLLAILAAIIGGVSHLVKKKKAASLAAEDSAPGEGEAAPVVAAEPPSGKFHEMKAKILEKLKPVIAKLEPLLSKLRKKKPVPEQTDEGADPNAAKEPNENEPPAELTGTEPLEPAPSAEEAGQPVDSEAEKDVREATGENVAVQSDEDSGDTSAEQTDEDTSETDAEPKVQKE